MDKKLRETTPAFMCRKRTGKGETWTRSTNLRLPFDVNAMLNLSNTKLVSDIARLFNISLFGTL